MRSLRIGFCALSIYAAMAIAGCSGSATVPQYSPASAGFPQPAKASASQYLYVYNEGSPGVYYGEYARYSLPDLVLQETTEADGVASPEAFGSSGLPYFVDEADQGAFAVFLQPTGKGVVPEQEEFYGVPCQSTSLATGPTGNFYVVQYCSGNVVEYSKSKVTGKPKKPIATFSGGNLTGEVYPTYAIVDPKGNLYVGDIGGGVTFFKAGSTKGEVALATGAAGYVNQMAVDSHGDVLSVHGPSPTSVYFKDEKTCIPDPSGSIVRNEHAERFSNGTLAQRLYSATSDSPVYATDGLSIAVDSSGRVYTGNQDTSDDGVLVDFDPHSSCPNDGLSFVLPVRAFPQVAVDNERRFYVTDYNDNTISAYTGGSKKRLKQITQKKSVIAITFTAINP